MKAVQLNTLIEITTNLKNIAESMNMGRDIYDNLFDAADNAKEAKKSIKGGNDRFLRMDLARMRGGLTNAANLSKACGHNGMNAMLADVIALFDRMCEEAA